MLLQKTFLVIFTSINIFAGRELNNAFFNAVSKCDINLMDLYFGQGVNVNARNHRGWTMLNLAILSEKPLCVVKKLLELGADVNLRNHVEARTPLMYAIEGNNYEAIEELLHHKELFLDATDHFGNTALSIAYQEGKSTAVCMLLTAGAAVRGAGINISALIQQFPQCKELLEAARLSPCEHQSYTRKQYLCPASTNLLVQQRELTGRMTLQSFAKKRKQLHQEEDTQESPKKLRVQDMAATAL